MSAFLGPIHYWLYNKIQIQQNIVDEIHSRYGLSLKEECDVRYGEFDNRPLEEIIDQSNIHGWLQERVSQVEYKYAYSIKALLDKDPSLLSQLEELLTLKGRELGQNLKETSKTAALLFKVISDNLLDGMPCDHANSLVENSDDRLVWKRNLCVHEDYWAAVGADISIYYRLREAWIKGLVDVSGFTFKKIDSVTYSIEKAA
ncbi:hypothetical protein [Herbinix luporum]|jgi:hypothetical protein|uniref:Uncharacterized protein n=1 Tax=Herbinix luporum TaxID=1679721 RepID=A0A0K8J8L0_9FIRM|nr:hypothetical protein [Herbinix luporum]MDI9489677.1 hypothetical protein [Bacillota bacterium]CUH93804.1 hypothetical protein SD1D_2292 [Herbinix luporum]HHT57578.1 hypothetical protein [Herbinix luporum]